MARELDLPGMRELPLVIPRERVAEYLERIQELRDRLEQQNDVSELKRYLRQIVRTGSDALQSYRNGAPVSVLEDAIQDMLSNANRRLG